MDQEENEQHTLLPEEIAFIAKLIDPAWEPKGGHRIPTHPGADADFMTWCDATGFNHSHMFTWQGWDRSTLEINQVDPGEKYQRSITLHSTEIAAFVSMLLRYLLLQEAKRASEILEAENFEDHPF